MLYIRLLLEETFGDGLRLRLFRLLLLRCLLLWLWCFLGLFTSRYDMLILVHLKVEVDEDLGSFLLSILLYSFVLFELLRSADAASERESILRVILACWWMSHSKRALGASLAFWRSSTQHFA